LADRVPRASTLRAAVRSKALSWGEERLDRIQIRAIGRQVEQPDGGSRSLRERLDKPWRKLPAALS
jgi:hypothetical protein